MNQIFYVKRGDLWNAILNHAASIPKFAEEAGIPCQTIYNVLKKSTAQSDTLQKICKVLGKDAATFIKGEKPHPKERGNPVDVLALKFLVKARKMSYKKLALKAGVNKQTIHRLNRTGRALPSTLKKLSVALGVKVDELIVNGQPKVEDPISETLKDLLEMVDDNAAALEELATEVGIRLESLESIRRTIIKLVEEFGFEADELIAKEKS